MNEKRLNESKLRHFEVLLEPIKERKMKTKKEDEMMEKVADEKILKKKKTGAKLQI